MSHKNSGGPRRAPRGPARDRLRVRTDRVLIGPCYNTYTKPGAADILDGPYNTVLMTYYESIADRVNDPSTIKPVRHFRVFGNYGFTNAGTYWNSAGGYTGISNLCVYYAPEDIDTTLMPKFGGTDLSDASRAAYTQFSTQIPGHVDFFNFIRELPEVKDLAEAIANLLKKLLDVRHLRDGFLAYSFGLKPLLSDIKALSTIVQRVLDRLDWLRKTRNKPTKMNYFTRKDINTPFGYPSSSGFTTLFPCTQYSALFRAHCVLTQNLEGLDTIYGTILAFASALGLLNPAKIIWNALKYSFVLDWFFKIGSFLDQLDAQPLRGTWRLEQVHYSITEYATFESWHRFDPNLGNPWRLTGTVYAKRYLRALGLPVPATEFGVSGLSTNQQALLAALLDQRFGHK